MVDDRGHECADDRVGAGRDHESRPSGRAGVRVFDVDFMVEAPRRSGSGDYFSCSIVSGEGGLIFNNKGLNYSYRLGR